MSLKTKKPITVEDVNKCHERRAAAASKEAEDEDKRGKHHPVLDKMCTATRADLEHDFARFDGNGDGNISLNEFVEIMNRNNPDPYEESELVALFQAMDKDGGGSVCYHEFAVQWALDREYDE